MAGRQTPRKDELVGRITELRGQGKSWSDVVEIVTRDGFKDASGESYKRSTLVSSYARWTKEEAGRTVKPESGVTAEPEQAPTGEPETSPTETPPVLGAIETSESSMIPDPEIVFAGLHETSDGLTNGVTSIRESGMTEDTGRPSPTQEGESGLTQEMKALITEFMEQEVHRIMTGITVEEIQKSGRGGTVLAVKKSFSLPEGLWTEFESRFGKSSGQIASNHVAAALRMYLNLKPL